MGQRNTSGQPQGRVRRWQIFRNARYANTNLFHIIRRDNRGPFAFRRRLSRPPQSADISQTPRHFGLVPQGDRSRCSNVLGESRGPGRNIGTIHPGSADAQFLIHAAGLMFWLTRNRFDGSYLFLMAASVV
jgi:hypothetical protein